jgi:hypothetical protein
LYSSKYALCSLIESTAAELSSSDIRSDFWKESKHTHVDHILMDRLGHISVLKQLTRIEAVISKITRCLKRKGSQKQENMDRKSVGTGNFRV